MSAFDSPWDDAKVERLRKLWMLRENDAVISMAEIARRMNISKGAVVGKVHRLGLEPRPSPIKHDVDRVVKAHVARVARVPRPRQTLPTLQSEYDAPVVAQPVRRTGTTGDCCFPIGDPGTPSFHFCNARSLPGKPYCEAHDAIVYVRVRDRREQTA